MRYRYIFFLISLCFIIPGLYSLFRYGLKPSIDFTGGALIELKTTDWANSLTVEDFQNTVADKYQIASVQESGKQQYVLRGKELNNQTKEDVLALLKAKYGNVELLRFETVGPILGRELLVKTLTAGVIVALMITFYVSWRFTELKFGISAVLAMLHDSLILIGSFSILGVIKGAEIDVLFVTALLTILSFSVHDTIVVYDRIREKRRNVSGVSLQTIINAAVIETMGRSINNSITIIIMLLTLALLGGDTIRWFAIALLIGSITGTYSSTFTAAPLLLLWDDIAKKVKQRKSGR